MPRRAITFCCVLLLALLALTAACGDDSGDGDSPTPTTEESTEPMATSPAGTATSDIRTVDFTTQPGMQSFLATNGGEVDTTRIIYVDLTSDGLEDAVVPVSSGGEGGDIAVFVYGSDGSGVVELLKVEPQVSTSVNAIVVGDTLQVNEPVYSADDPMCCPSQVKTTTYAWDGSQLAVSNEETKPAEGN